jgi:hypothetical protein
MPIMLHPTHRSFRLPAVYVALCQFLYANRDFRDDEIPSWSHVWGDLLLCDSGPFNPLTDPGPPQDPIELTYDHQPVEIIPFGREGGDALHYGWAVLAPELDLDDHPCVSFAPIDGHAVWLGDNTKQALENLLVGRVANWQEWGAPNEPSPASRRSWAALCEALDLHPNLDSSEITPGARSSRDIDPPVPPGWLYQPTEDGIGVLTEQTAVAPFDVEIDPRRPVEETVAEARKLLRAGYPADALCLLKDAPPGIGTMQAMRDTYAALGRTMHVERAEIWLRLRRG